MGGKRDDEGEKLNQGGAESQRKRGFVALWFRSGTLKNWRDESWLGG